RSAPTAAARLRDELPRVRIPHREERCLWRIDRPRDDARARGCAQARRRDALLYGLGRLQGHARRDRGPEEGAGLYGDRLVQDTSHFHQATLIAEEQSLTKPKWQPSTIAAQAGGAVDPVTGAIVPPIQMA